MSTNKVILNTLLFNPEKVKKFFKILSRLGRSVEKRYKGYIYKDSSPCERQVFVNRTLNKWFNNPHLILYRTSEQTGVEYKQYITILNISYKLSWGVEIDVMIYDYTKPYDIYEHLTISHNTALSLEGKWCKNGNLHHKLIKMAILDIPEKEFVFKAYDWNKYPKRRKKNQTDEDINKLMETTISVKVKTVKEAYKKKQEFVKNQMKEGLTKLVVLSDIYQINKI